MTNIIEAQSDEVVVSVDNEVITFQNTETVIASSVVIQEEHLITQESDPVLSSIETESDQIITIETQEEVINTFETSPPKGDKGDPGELIQTIIDARIVQFEVAYAMSGHRMVVLDENEQAIYASCDNVLHMNKVIGMTIGALISGLISIQTYGIIEEPSWNWTLDVPVWLSTDGLLSQTPPISGFSLVIGFPISSIKMNIDIREPILLV